MTSETPASAADDPRVGDVVRMRKAHPCGSDTWRIVRVGADLGLRCQGCDRKVFLPRSRFRRQLRETISRGEAAPPPIAARGDDTDHAP